MKDNKKIITMTLLIIGIVLIVGTSYAFFVYVRESSKNSQLIAGEVYMHYVDGTNTISLNNAFVVKVALFLALWNSSTIMPSMSLCLRISVKAPVL